MIIDDVFKCIDNSEDRFMKLWREICAVETPSSDKSSLDFQTDIIKNFCIESGFVVVTFEFNQAGNFLLIETNTDRCKNEITLLAHMDTVHKKGLFGGIPVKEEGGFLFGPGVVDCKGGIAVALMAMNAFQLSGINETKIKLLLTSDEEVNAKYSGKEGIDLIKNTVNGSIACFNCEVGKQGFITVGRKGTATIEIQVNGKSAHAGNAYFEGVNAIKEAAYKIINIEKNSSSDGITYNCGSIEGGSVSNIVPDRCSFHVDIRFYSLDDYDEALSVIGMIVDNTYVEGSQSTMRVLAMRPPMEKTNDNMVLFEKIRTASNKWGLEKLNPLIRGGGSDSAYTVQVGVPTLCSMGVIGEFEHTVRERALTSSLVSRSKLLAASILEVIEG